MVRLTPDGEAFLPFAIDLQRANESAELHLREPPLAGTVRLGIVEDYAGTRLSGLLGRFSRLHRSVHLLVETGLSEHLSDRLNRGDFDLVLSKRANLNQKARVVFREQLEWAIAPVYADIVRRRPLPLVLHPRPSVTSEAVVSALRSSGIDGVIVLTSPSVAGLKAGILAGLGVGAFGSNFLPDGLVPISGADAELPELPPLEYGLERRAGNLSKPIKVLAGMLEGLSHAPDHAGG